MQKNGKVAPCLNCPNRVGNINAEKMVPGSAVVSLGYRNASVTYSAIGRHPKEDSLPRSVGNLSEQKIRDKYPTLYDGLADCSEPSVEYTDRTDIVARIVRRFGIQLKDTVVVCPVLETEIGPEINAETVIQYFEVQQATNEDKVN